MAKLNRIKNIKRSDLRIPYYDIQIYDEIANRVYNVPQAIKRLIKKISIYESINGHQGSDDGSENFHNVVTLELVEGSREPFSNNGDIGGSKDLYPTAEITQVTNRTGSIVDLQFPIPVKAKNIEIEEKATQNILKDSEVFKNNLGTENVTADDLNEKLVPNNFVFSYGHKLIVTWGYILNGEDQSSRYDLTRTISTMITNVQTDYRDSGQIQTSITAYGTSVNFQSLSGICGTSFTESRNIEQNVSSIINAATESIPFYLIDDKILEGDEFGVKFIIDPDCDDNNTEFISRSVSASSLADISKKQRKDLADNLKPFADIWRRTPDLDLMTFFQILAKKTNSVFDIVEDPNGQIKIFFIAKKNFYSYIQNTDFKEFFNYKNPESIIKNVSISVDFAGNGEMKTGVTALGADGTFKYDIVDKAGKFYNTNKLETEAAKKLKTYDRLNKAFYAGCGTRGNQVTPEVDNQKRNENKFSVESTPTLSITFKCLGFPILLPGTVELQGLGSRYSKSNYRIYNVVHTIDEGGYTTEASGTQNHLPNTEDGTKSKEASKQTKPSGSAKNSVVESYYKTKLEIKKLEIKKRN